ncbi:DUF2848 family protein [Paraburkholderia sp. UCT2]|uniref:DUF2848 family protein n=1 Tax=Paraburkholderia sp. UCT2 TaxID=2615208 RepID=UPI0039750E1E
MGAKPAAAEARRFNEVASHWDRIFLRAWIVGDRERMLYQEGQVRPCSTLPALQDALAECEETFRGGTVA